jgi:hypothetical protein
MIVVFSMLTAAELSDAAWWFFEPHGKLWCGNVVSDPLGFNLNILAPVALGSALGVIRQCSASRRWPLLCQFSIVLLIVSVVVLLAATRFIAVECGLPMGHIWWLPSFARPWLLGR